MDSEMINIVYLIIIIYALIFCTDSLKESKFKLTYLCIFLVCIFLVCIFIFKLDIDIFIIISFIYLLLCLMLLFFTKKYVKPKKPEENKDAHEENKDAHEENKNKSNKPINNKKIST